MLDATTRRPRRWGFAFGFLVLCTFLGRFALQNTEAPHEQITESAPLPERPPVKSVAEKRAAKQWAA